MSSVSGAAATYAGGGAMRGGLAESTGAGAAGQQQVSDATGVHVDDCRVQCPARRWTGDQPAALDANARMSKMLKSCVARALTDMTKTGRAHDVPRPDSRRAGKRLRAAPRFQGLVASNRSNDREHDDPGGGAVTELRRENPRACRLFRSPQTFGARSR